MKKLLAWAYDLSMLLLIFAVVTANNNRDSLVEVVESTEFKTQYDYIEHYIWVLANLEEKPLLYPEVVLSQTILETGHFTSNVYWWNNNAVGMKPNDRGYTIDPSYCRDKDHGCYRTVYASFENYRDWQYEKIALYEEYYDRKVATVDDYLDVLNHVVLTTKSGGRIVRRYAEDPIYTDKLRRLMKDTLVTGSRVFPKSKNLD